MSAASGVPPWARPVLEALRDAAGWMRMEVQCEEDARRTAQKQHVAWLDLEARCARALASDAGMPEGERAAWEARTHHEPSEAALAAASAKFARPDPWPHICNHRALHQAVIAAYAVDFPALSTAPAPSAAPPTNVPETSTSLVDAAPEERDGELDDLLREYRDLVAEQEARVADHTEALKASLADIHAHVERMKREARGELLALVRATVADDALAATHQTMGSYRTALLQYLDVQDGRVGNTVRRREKEEG